jgi:hypothetical protein
MSTKIKMKMFTHSDNIKINNNLAKDMKLNNINNINNNFILKSQVNNKRNCSKLMMQGNMNCSSCNKKVNVL